MQHFKFAGFMEKYKVDFTYYDEDPGYYNSVGKWVEGMQTALTKSAIILPLTNDDIEFNPSGGYTRRDRKLYTNEPLTVGNWIEYKGNNYRIDQERPTDDYSDVYNYIAKGVDA